MEQTSFAMESIKDTAQTVQAMKAAGAELKTAFKKQDLNIDSIEKMQDEMADLMVDHLGYYLQHSSAMSREVVLIDCLSDMVRMCLWRAGHAQRTAGCHGTKLWGAR